MAEEARRARVPVPRVGRGDPPWMEEEARKAGARRRRDGAAMARREDELEGKAVARNRKMQAPTTTQAQARANAWKVGPPAGGDFQGLGADDATGAAAEARGRSPPRRCLPFLCGGGQRALGGGARELTSYRTSS